MEPPRPPPPGATVPASPPSGSKKRKQQAESTDLASFVEQIREVAGAGPDKFKEKAGIILGYEVREMAEKQSSSNLAQTIHFLRESCQSGNLSIDSTSSDKIGSFVQDLKTIKIYLKDPQFKDNPVAKSVIDDIDNLRNLLGDEGRKRQKDTSHEAPLLSSQVLSLFTPEQQVAMLRQQNSITKEALPDEGIRLPAYRLTFSKGLEKIVDDSMLKIILESLKSELQDVKEFDFSKYPRLSAEAPALILQYCPKLDLSCLSTLGNEARFLDMQVKIGDESVMTNKGLLFHESSEMKDYVQDIGDQAIEFAFADVRDDTIKNFFGLITGRIDPQNLAIDQLFEIAIFADKFNCQKMVKRCGDAIRNTFSSEANKNTLTTESINKVLTLQEMTRAVKGLEPLRKLINDSESTLLYYLFRLEIEGILSTRPEKPTPTQFNELYNQTLLNCITKHQQKYPDSCFRNLQGYLTESGVRSFLGKTEFQINFTESSHFLDFVRLVESLIEKVDPVKFRSEIQEVLCRLGSVYATGLKDRLPANVDKAIGYFQKAIELSPQDSSEFRHVQLPFLYLAKLYLYGAQGVAADQAKAIDILKSQIQQNKKHICEEFYLLLADNIRKNTKAGIKDPFDFLKIFTGKRPEADLRPVFDLLREYMLSYDSHWFTVTSGAAIRTYIGCLMMTNEEAMKAMTSLGRLEDILTCKKYVRGGIDKLCLLIGQVHYAKMFPDRVAANQPPGFSVQNHLAALVTEMNELAQSIPTELTLSPIGPIVQELLQSARKIAG